MCMYCVRYSKAAVKDNIFREVTLRQCDLEYDLEKSCETP